MSFVPDFSGQSVLVLGLGDTGLSTARWLASHGARVTVADTRVEPPGAERLAAELPRVRRVSGAFSDALFAAADWVVASPGVPLATPAIQRAMAAGKAVIGDVELFARARAAHRPDQRVIAITGSNGKSTVTALAGALCRGAGRQTVVAGNIGLPVLDALGAVERGQTPEPEVWVLELSSFQLETTSSLGADAATVLNLSEDHMDRYADMAAYAAAKARIFEGARIQVANRNDPVASALVRPGCPVISFGLDAPPGNGDYGLVEGVIHRGRTPLVPVNDLPLTGLHNAANVMAAFALTDGLGLDDADRLAALAAFRGLPHRVEWVAKIGGVDYYDDSKGTNVGATEAALTGMGVRRAVVILGGDGKGQDFSPLAPAVARHARAVVLIGRDAPKIGDALGGTGVPRVMAASLEAAVAAAHAQALPGDAVLLSPACASFDMFRNYVHRAEVFVAAVEALKRRVEGAQ